MYSIYFYYDKILFDWSKLIITHCHQKLFIYLFINLLLIVLFIYYYYLIIINRII